WRIVTLQRSDVRESRSWIVIQPRLVATGPSDPSIAPFRLAEDDVTAIGFCGSGQRQGTSPALVVGVWQQAVNRSWKPQAIAGSRLGGIDGGGVATVYAPVAVLPGLNGSAGGQVSGVPAGSGRAGVPAGSGASSSSGIPSSIAGSSPWAPGRYVFKVIVANTPTSTYWFRIDLIWPPEPLPSESPLPSATPPTASPSVALPPG
ncbi:MAG TPA: hypothetical protein VNF73_07020, partial [Candidatus Saccharimonadales bacterium]|nr:hypothetical protein [Candidatus Saccharimonadales bacterium]